MVQNFPGPAPHDPAVSRTRLIQLSTTRALPLYGCPTWSNPQSHQGALASGRTRIPDVGKRDVMPEFPMLALQFKRYLSQDAYLSLNVWACEQSPDCLTAQHKT